MSLENPFEIDTQEKRVKEVKKDSSKECLIIKSLNSNYDEREGVFSFLFHFFGKKDLKYKLNKILNQHLESGLLLSATDELASSIIDRLWQADFELINGKKGGKPIVTSLLLYSLALELNNSKSLRKEEVLAVSAAIFEVCALYFGMNDWIPADNFNHIIVNDIMQLVTPVIEKNAVMVCSNEDEYNKILMRVRAIELNKTVSYFKNLSIPTKQYFKFSTAAILQQLNSGKYGVVVDCIDSIFFNIKPINKESLNKSELILEDIYNYFSQGATGMNMALGFSQDLINSNTNDPIVSIGMSIYRTKCQALAEEFILRAHIISLIKQTIYYYNGKKSDAVFIIWNELNQLNDLPLSKLIEVYNGYRNSEDDYGMAIRKLHGCVNEADITKYINNLIPRL